jgi:hypothetical protein
MKVMGIGKKFTRMIEIAKYEKKQKFLNKYVNIDTTINNDAYKQLYVAREGVANYLSKKGLTVEIKDARNRLEEPCNPMLKEKLKDKLDIFVTDMTTGRVEGEIIDGNVNKIITNTKKDYIVIDDPSEGTQIVRLTEHSNENNFLRNFYLNVEKLANRFQK